MKIVAIGGEPATGKTTLMKTLIFRYLFEVMPFEYNNLVGMIYQMSPTLAGDLKVGKRVFVLGKYLKESKGNEFEGTDKLPMNVQPNVEKLIYKLSEQERKGERPLAVILFEGDRLFNGKLFDYIIPFMNIDHLKIILHTEDSKRRREERGHKQDVRWLNSRATKINNIIIKYPNTDIRLNDNKQDMENTINLILKFITS